MNDLAPTWMHAATEVLVVELGRQTDGDEPQRDPAQPDGAEEPTPSPVAPGAGTADEGGLAHRAAHRLEPTADTSPTEDTSPPTEDTSPAATTMRFERVRPRPAEGVPRWVGRARLRPSERAGEDLRRRQIGHDIHHELGTIMMLASLLSCSPDVGPESQERARQIMGEARWLDQLQRAYEDTLPSRNGRVSGRPASIRLDTVAADVVAAMQLSTITQVRLAAGEAWARTDRLAYWRAVRNVVGNAVRAAGPRGRVDVRVFVEGGWVITEVDDDGPGFGRATPGYGSLGLGIVRDATSSFGGDLEIGHSAAGGGRVRIKLPVAAPSVGDLGVAV